MVPSQAGIFRAPRVVVSRPPGREFCPRRFRKSGLAASGYFEASAIDRLIEQHRSGLSDHGRVLWLLWMFQGFLKTVHAPEAVQPVGA